MSDTTDRFSGCYGFRIGHGASAIAGYNTMPVEQRKPYDEKALCRISG